MDDCNESGLDNAVQENVPPVTLQRKKKFCKYCGKELNIDDVFCSSCGRQQGNVPVQQIAGQMMQQSVYGMSYMASAYPPPQPAAVSSLTANNTTTVIVEESPSNGIGVAGFVIALVGLFFFWLPLINILFLLFGFVFSVAGVFKAPRDMAIAGLVLSLIDFLIILYMMGSITAALALD